MSNAGKADPGWNDPPMFAYNTEVTPTKPRNLLNKRVPFVSNPIPTSNDPKLPFSLPPSGPPVSIKKTEIVNLLSNECSQNQSQQNLHSGALIDAITIFKKLVEESPELGKKAADIEKRLNVMENMWKEEKLNDDVQSKTYQIATALAESNVKLADDIHKSLMVDYISIVSPWMVGIKHLILHYTAKNDLIKLDTES